MSHFKLDMCCTIQVMKLYTGIMKFDLQNLESEYKINATKYVIYMKEN